jgi:hypothetical protein
MLIAIEKGPGTTGYFHREFSVEIPGQFLVEINTLLLPTADNPD